MEIKTTVREIAWAKYEFKPEFSLGDVSLTESEDEILGLIGNDRNGAKKLYEALCDELANENEADDSWHFVQGVPCKFRRRNVPITISITGNRRVKINITEIKNNNKT